MKIDLSKNIYTITGKVASYPETNEIGRPKLNEVGEPVIKEVDVWEVIEMQLNSYSGNEMTMVRAIGNSMVKALEEGHKTIDVSADILVFLKNKVIKPCKISDLSKDQVLQHLNDEEAAHKKSNPKKKEEEKSVEEQKDTEEDKAE